VKHVNHLACIVAMATARIAAADPVPDPERAIGMVSGLSVQAPGMLQLGHWDAMNIGFQGFLGLRYRRLTLLAEGDELTMWPADWANGAENSNLQGDMQRLALDARFAVVSRGHWAPDKRRGETFGIGEIYVEVSPGIERIHIDGEDTITRRDVAFGIGTNLGGRMSPHGIRFTTFYALRMTLATDEPTPSGAIDTTARCSSACTAPAGHGLDVGVAFQLGVLFGS
jgi:hypothetical protein